MSAALRRPGPDATSVLVVHVVLLMAIPAQWVVPGLGAAGRPAGLLGLVALGWLVMALLTPGLGVPGQGRAQPLRVALLIVAVTALVSYALAFTRVIPAVEVRAADRALLSLAGLAGVALLGAEGITSRDRLDTVLRWIVWVTAALAAVGVLQFVTGFDLAALIRIPGLVQNEGVEFVQQRSDFRRVAGTASHPIEFSVLMASALPLALHLAMHDRPGRRRRWVLPLLLLGAAIPASLSRTGILCTAVVLAILLPVWPRRVQIAGLVVGAMAVVVLRTAIPGLIGTITGLFLNLFQDTSTTARTQDYGVAAGYIAESPLFGRGVGTFLPTEYEFLDNQILLSLVETGAMGLTALLLLFVVGASLARGARRRSGDAAGRHLGQALAAAVIGHLVSFATYDALSFPMASGMLFLLLGCCGALWRLERTPAPAPPLPRAPVAVRPRVAVSA